MTDTAALRARRAAALIVAALLLRACASQPVALEPAQLPPSPADAASTTGRAPAVDAPKAPEEVVSPKPPAPSAGSDPVAGGFAALPGWLDEDHAAAFLAWRAGCGASRDGAIKALCQKAKDMAFVDNAFARRFFEENFRIEAVRGEGVLTAYFSPVYEARDTPGGEFLAPVRPPPGDLRTGRLYADRTAIEDRPPNNVLAWMRAEDLFFLQIQGSGTLVYPDGRRMKAVFAAHNGQTFRGVANPMRDLGLLAANNTSGDAIRAWLAEHRGPEANRVMQLNPRYVFFRLEPDDNIEPRGAAGIPLPAGHAIAVDPAFHAYGQMFWINAEAPTLSGAFPVYRRLVMALDTGGAIKGEVRADLYMGRGDEAGREAGRVRHTLHMYRLVPLDQPRP